MRPDLRERGGERREGKEGSGEEGVEGGRVASWLLGDACPCYISSSFSRRCHL